MRWLGCEVGVGFWLRWGQLVRRNEGRRLKPRLQ